MSDVAWSCSSFQSPLVGRGDGYEFRVVRLFGVFDHEHHLSRFSGESFFCGRDDVVSVLFVIHVSVQHHDTRQLERVVQPADVPLVGLVGDRRYVQSGDVGRQSVMFEHRFVVFIMNDRPQRPVRGRFEYRVERQRFGLLQCECGPSRGAARCAFRPVRPGTARRPGGTATGMFRPGRSLFREMRFRTAICRMPVY